MARHEGSSRSTWTRRWAEPSRLLSRRIPRQRSDVLPNGRWKDKTRPSSLGVDQDAIRDQVVRLEKLKGTENEADLGIKDLDGPAHQRLLQKLPLKPTQYRRLLA